MKVAMSGSEEPEPREETTKESWARYHREIDERLDKIRPERVGSGEKDWREPVYGWARNHIPDETTLVRHFAQAEVDRREGVATKRANGMLREWAKGQRPLFWSDIGPLPIVVAKLRIRLDVATPDDVEDAALELAAKGKLTYDEVVLLSHAMLDLSRTARRSGLGTVAQLGDLAEPPGGFTATSDETDDEADW